MTSADGASSILAPFLAKGCLWGAVRVLYGAKGCNMSGRYYRLLSGAAASLSLIVAGCGSDRPAATAANAAPGATPAVLDPMGTDATLWTILGLATKESEKSVGPQVGDDVSPILWQAAHDTLHFAGFGSEDPMAGLLVTDWYSPPNQPNERLRISVFITSRALHSDSVAVSVERQVRSPVGPWTDTPVARDVATGLEGAILRRAQQIHAEHYRETIYK